MSGRLALALCDLAGRVLPVRRKAWADAMKAEVGRIADDRSALTYGAGCLLAATTERARDFDTRFAAGLWLVALVSGALAIFHVRCAAQGIDVLLGARDGFLEALVSGGRADIGLMASYQRARPIVIACLFCLGSAHFFAAWYLLRMQLRRFFIAWCAALLAAALAVGIQLSIVWSLDGLPAEFVALLVQAVTLPALLLWSDGRHRKSGEMR